MKLAILCALSVVLLAPFCKGQSAANGSGGPSGTCSSNFQGKANASGCIAEAWPSSTGAAGNSMFPSLSYRGNTVGTFSGGESKSEIIAFVGALRNSIVDSVTNASVVPGQSTVPGSTPNPFYNVVFVDGCAANVTNPQYDCNTSGVQQAILAANGHAGVAGVVVIPPTANCPPSRCPQLAVQMNANAISMPSFTYIIGYGKYASEFDYAGTGCAFDFPAGTVDSGLIGIGLEQENAANSGICMEGSYTGQTYDNVISDVYLANNLLPNGFVSGQKGIVITSSPQWGNGTGFIRSNIFRDVLILGVNQPVVANASTQSRWDIKIQGVGPSQTAISLCGMSDVIDVSVEDYESAQSNTVAFAVPGPTCTNSQVRLVANLIGSGAKMLNDLGNGNEIHISDTNASGLGTPSSTALTVYCEALSPYCMVIQPQ